MQRQMQMDGKALPGSGFHLCAAAILRQSLGQPAQAVAADKLCRTTAIITCDKPQRIRLLPQFYRKL